MPIEATIEAFRMITPLSLSSGSAFWTANPAQALLQCLLGFIEYPAQSRFDMATHGATFFDRVLMDRECFWCLDRTIDLEQRDITRRPGQPAGALFARCRFDQASPG